MMFAQGISQNAPFAKQHMAASMYPEAVSYRWGGSPPYPASYPWSTAWPIEHLLKPREPLSEDSQGSVNLP